MKQKYALREHQHKFETMCLIVLFVIMVFVTIPDHKNIKTLADEIESLKPKCWEEVVVEEVDKGEVYNSCSMGNPMCTEKQRAEAMKIWDNEIKCGETICLVEYTKEVCEDDEPKSSLPPITKEMVREAFLNKTVTFPKKVEQKFTKYYYDCWGVTRDMQKVYFNENEIDNYDLGILSCGTSTYVFGNEEASE